MDFARILRGFCVGFARNLILFLFEREREGYKRFADCTVPSFMEIGLPVPEKKIFEGFLPYMGVAAILVM